MVKLISLIAAFICLFEFIDCESVKVHFMDYTSTEWTSTYEANVKEVVASQLNEYCSQSDCALKSTTQIKSQDIVFEGLSGNTHTIDGRFIIVKISAKLDGTELSAEVLNNFLVARRENIVSQGKVAIAYIDDVLVYPPRDQTDNYVIITIFTTLTVGLFVLNMILSNKRTKKEMESLREAASKASVSKDKVDKAKLANGGKTNIYTPNTNDEGENLLKNQGINKKSMQFDESMPLNTLNEEEDSVPGFPKANADPLLTTSDSMYNGIRVNPNMRLTQV